MHGAASAQAPAQPGNAAPPEVDKLDAIRMERLARIEQRQRDIDVLRQRPVEIDVEEQLREAAAKTVQTAWRQHTDGQKGKLAAAAWKARSGSEPREHTRAARNRAAAAQVGEAPTVPLPPEEPILSSTVEHMLRERMAVALERMAVSIPTNADQFAAAEEAKALLSQFQERRIEAARQAGDRRRLMHETATAISREEYWARRPLQEITADPSTAEFFIPKAGDRYDRAKAAYAACMAQAASSIPSYVCHSSALRSDKWWKIHKAKVAADHRRVMAALDG